MSKNIWIIIGIVVLIFFVGYLILNNSSFEEQSYTESSNMGEPAISADTRLSANSCPKEILPDKIILLNAEGFVMSKKPIEVYYTTGKGVGIENNYKIINSQWKDGTPLTIFYDGYNVVTMADPDCRKGNNQGENINYFYCKTLVYASEKKDIDNSGNILKIENTTYHVDIVLNPLEGEDWLESNQVIGGDLHVKFYANYSIVSSKCITQED